MELFPAADVEQFEFIKRVIDDCDYYIVIVGGRYGSLSEDGLSYTEKEFRYAREKGIPVLAFIHETPNLLAVNKSEVDPSLREKLETFKAELKSRRLAHMWSSSAELIANVVIAVSQARKSHPRPGWVRGDQATSRELLQDCLHARQHIDEIERELQSREAAERETEFHSQVIAYDVDRKRTQTQIALDIVFLTIAAVIAVPTRFHIVQVVIEDMIRNFDGVEGSVSLTDSDMQRICSAFFAKGLIDIAEDEQGCRTMRITDKGRIVLSCLVARQEAPI